MSPSKHHTAFSLAIVALILAGCGARSQLIAPDVGFPDVTDVTDVVDVHDAQAVQPPIDPTCPSTCPLNGVAPIFPAAAPLVAPDVPLSCSNGFEMGGATGGCGRATYALHAIRPGGSRGITLDVDFATYLVPDAVLVTGIDATGVRYTLLQTCRLQTSFVGGPSNMRPGDDTIRQFRLDVRPGTTELDFDFGAVTSPMYIRVLGLCDFAVTPFAAAAWWRAVP